MAEQVTIEIRGVDRASGALRRVGGALGDISRVALGLIAFRVFERLASGIFNLAKQAAEAYQWFDQIRFALGELSRAEFLEKFKETELTAAGMEKVLGAAADEAQNLLDWVIRLGLESPFTAKDVNQMFRLMRAYGFTTDRAKELTGIILDFSAATGFGSQVLERMGLALGQVRQRGRLAGEEIRQLINVGIPVRDIVAKAMEVTTGELEKMIRKGLVPASKALPAIVEWMTRFDGASERAVSTWWGLVNNMKDVKELGMIKVFDGIAKSAQPALQSLFDYLSREETFEMFEEIGKEIGSWVGPLLEKIPEVITNLDMLRTIIEGIGEGWTTPGGLVAGFLNILGIIEQGDVQTVNETINSIADSFNWFADSISKIAEVWVGAIANELPDWLANLGGITFGAFDEFVPMWERFTDSMVAMSETAAPQILTDITEGLDGITEWWRGGANESAAEIVGFLLTLGGAGVIGALASLATTFGILGDVLSGRDPLPRMEKLGELFQTLAEDVSATPMFQDFATSLSQVLIMPGLTDEHLLDLRASGEAIPEGIVTGMQSAESRVAASVVASLNASVSDPATFWGNMTGEQKARVAGGAVAEALGDGFLNEMASQKKEIEVLLMEIISMIDEVYKIRSPSRVFMEKGEQMGAGLMEGILGQGQDILRGIRSMGTRIQQAIEYNITPTVLTPALMGSIGPTLAASPPGSPNINVTVKTPPAAESSKEDGRGLHVENLHIQDKLTAITFGQAFEEFTGVR